MQQRAPPWGCHPPVSGMESSAGATAPESEGSWMGAASGSTTVSVTELAPAPESVSSWATVSAVMSVSARAQASAEASAEAQGTALAWA